MVWQGTGNKVIIWRNGGLVYWFIYVSLDPYAVTLLEGAIHWGRVTHICVSKLTIIGSDNGLSPGRRQAIIWSHARILLIRPLGTRFSEILIEMFIFSFKKMHLKMSSGNWRSFCLGPNVLTRVSIFYHPSTFKHHKLSLKELTNNPILHRERGIQQPFI